MKRLSFIIYLSMFLFFAILTSCIGRRPSTYLFQGDYKGLKKEVLKNKNFIKRKNCKKNQCQSFSYSLVDYLCSYDFKSPEEDEELLRFLIRNGAEITNKDFTKYYFEPLYRALSLNKYNMAKILIEAGANINDIDYMGDSALMIESKKKDNVKMLEYLLKNNAKINILNKNRKSALDIALQVKNNNKNIEYLLKHGAKLNWKNNIFFNMNNKNNLKQLMKYNILIINNNNYVYYDRNQNGYNRIIIKKLINYFKDIHADLTLEGRDYLRPIHKLLLFKSNEIIKKEINLCLKKSKNCKKYLNSFSYMGFSPIDITILDNNDDLLNFLIEKGANINLQNKFKQTPLHIAIIMKKTNAINLLLLSGAKINIEDLLGNTPKVLYTKYFEKDLSKLKDSLFKELKKELKNSINKENNINNSENRENPILNGDKNKKKSNKNTINNK